ncbi:uncharacterized protein LOC131158726 [Malania oleifera]|uniref:uncharacterized protein LOC131158726 n=1 Tax=Malania oleifera TaxID=397392 RepID=UPI0025AE9ACA|nr:uncharacterized protein LOC131158726 [Malania oleifera]
MTLNSKNKFGFVNGTLSKPTSSSAETQLWERCSDMVLSWILNSIDPSSVHSLIYHECPRDVWLDLENRFSQSNNPRIFKLKRDIANLTQGSMNISVYFTTLKDTERVFQFLMELHDSYASIRSQILAMDPLPSVTKVYSILHQEEKQRLLHISTVPTESAAMAVPRPFSHPSDSKGQRHGHPKCGHCGHDGHWKAQCYKLHGFPNNKSQSHGTPDRKLGSSMAANTVTSPSPSSEVAVHGLTNEQYHQLLDLLSPPNTNFANFAGNLTSCHSVFSSNTEWIIDSSASDHMTSNLSSLDNIQLLNQPCSLKLPNGPINEEADWNG